MRWLAIKSLQTYWRMTRSLTLGAQGLVVDSENRVLLVRHTYRPGWHFPGGGVEKNEAGGLALARELKEEAGVLLTAAPDLFGIYTHFDAFPGDHILLYVCRSWTQPVPPPPNYEIAERGFFSLSALPPETTEPTRRRLAEVFAGEPRAAYW